MSDETVKPPVSPGGESGVGAEQAAARGARAEKSLPAPSAETAGAVASKSLGSGISGGAGAGTESPDASMTKHAAATASRVTSTAEQDAMSAATAAREGRVVDAGMDAAAAAHPVGKAVREAREQGRYAARRMDRSMDSAMEAMIGDHTSDDSSKPSDDSKSSADRDSSKGAGQTSIQPKNAEHSSRSLGKAGHDSYKNNQRSAGKDIAAGTGAAGAGAVGAQAFTMATIFQWLKSLFFNLMAMVNNLWSMFVGMGLAIFGALKAGVLGLGATISAAVGGAVSAAVAGLGTVVLAVAVPLGAGITIVQSTLDAQRSDTLLPCTDRLAGSIDKAKAAGLDVQTGDSATTEENAKKIYGILAAAGADNEGIAGVLGNFDVESGIDPTSVETIFNEPQKIGPKKKAAEKAGFSISAIDASYAARFPAIKQAGIGFGQWTNERNTALVEYAKKVGKPWYDAETQMGFMLTQDSSSATFKQYVKTKHGSPEAASSEFQTKWEGNPGSGTAARSAASQKWFAKMGGWKANKEHLDSLLKQSGGSLDDSSGGSDAIKDAANNGLNSAMKDCQSSNETVSYGGSLGPDASGDAGPIPSGSWGQPFKWNQVPDKYKKYAINPESVGLKHGDCTNWRPFIGDGGMFLNGQCVALSKALFGKFWQKDGHSPKGFTCNGDQCAAAAAAANGGNYSNKPKAGAVVSVDTGTVNGHTFVVSHVFANGDIFLVEQNTPDSGASATTGAEECSWNYRVVKKAGYESQNARFYTPPGYSVNPQLKTLGS